MGANIPRRNHYIPEMLQNNFCDDDGRLWVGDKCQSEPFRTSPLNVFVEGDLYTTNDYVQSVKTYENEGALQKIESDAKSAISAIIEQARDGCIPQLSIEDDDRFKRFIAAQIRRTPESQKRMGLFADIDKIFYPTAAVIKEKLGNTFVDEDWYEPTSLMELKQRYESNVPGNYAAGIHHLLEKETKWFCRNSGWRAAAIKMPKRSFVIGSLGVTVVERRGCRESWLPIAYDVAIMITPYPDKVLFLPLDRSKEPIIRAINQSTVAASRFIGGRSKALIDSLMRGYWK